MHVLTHNFHHHHHRHCHNPPFLQCFMPALKLTFSQILLLELFQLYWQPQDIIRYHWTVFGFFIFFRILIGLIFRLYCSTANNAVVLLSCTIMLFAAALCCWREFYKAPWLKPAVKFFSRHRVHLLHFSLVLTYVYISLRC